MPATRTKAVLSNVRRMLLNSTLTGKAGTVESLIDDICALVIAFEDDKISDDKLVSEAEKISKRTKTVLSCYDKSL